MKHIPVRRLELSQHETDFSKSFRIRAVHLLLNGQNYVQKLHRHDFFYILVLEIGEGCHEIDFIRYTMQNYSIFFLRPGQVHQLSLTANNRGYLIQFKLDVSYAFDKKINQQLRKVSNVNFYQFDELGFHKLVHLMEQMLWEYTHQQEAYQEVIQANLHIFLIEILRQHTKNTSKSINPYVQERLEEFLALLDTYLPQCKQVSQYADMLSLSPYQLNTITKNTLGKTCSALINEHIVLESKRHLLATSQQIKEIAYHLGYEDVSYFIRFFKKHTGYSPEAFRQNFR